MKILLIEDSRFLRFAIEKALQKAGYEVHGIGDGREALAAAIDFRPHLILLDMMLPGLEGTAVLGELKRNTTTEQIPVIVLTGLSKTNEAKLRKDGAAAYLEKSSLDLENNAVALISAITSVLPAPEGPPSSEPPPSPSDQATGEQTEPAEHYQGEYL